MCLTIKSVAKATVARIQISLDSSKSKHSPWTQTWVLVGHGNVRLQIGFCDSTMILPLPPVPEGPGGGGRRRQQQRQGYVGAEFFSFSNNDDWLACSQALKKMSARWEFIDRTTDYGQTKARSLILLRPQIQIQIFKGLVFLYVDLVEMMVE